jgi:hypothetical protein
MSRRFSGGELFEIRNALPIDYVIKDVLGLPVKTSDGTPRFLCPICYEFQTGTNPSTNLGRCFRCEKNFNVIDLSMIVKGSCFVETVKFLKRLLRDIKEIQEPEKRDIRDLLVGIGKSINQEEQP